MGTRNISHYQILADLQLRVESWQPPLSGLVRSVLSIMGVVGDLPGGVEDVKKLKMPRDASLQPPCETVRKVEIELLAGGRSLRVLAIYLLICLICVICG